MSSETVMYEHMFSLFWEILAGKGGGEMERFACETMVISGDGALSVLGESPRKRMLLLTEPEMIRGGQARRIVKAAQNPETEILEHTGREPTMQKAVEGSRKLKAFQPDLVVALGSGTVLDWGKAAVCFSKVNCILAAVPTAFGFGSEVTDRVTLSHNGRRHLLRDSTMRPKLALLDSGLITSSAREEIGEGGFELLAAALESYACGKGGTLSDLHAREAFASCWAVLPAAFSGNKTARGRLQMVSALAGMAVDRTGLGLCHAMENSLGTVFGLSRGNAAGILLPAIIGCNAHAAGRRYAELSRAAGMGGSREEIGIRNLKTGLIRLRRELGLPGTLVQAGVDLRSVWNNGKQIVELTLEDPECRNNPVAVDDFMVRRILDEVTGRF